MVLAVLALAGAGVIMLQRGDADSDGPAGSLTVPLGTNVTSVEEASQQLGRPVPLPGYLPPSVAFGPELVLARDSKKQPTGSIAMTYYDAGKKAAVRITQTAARTPAAPAPENRTIVTIDEVEVALLLNADLVRYRDGSIARHAYAEFTANGVSFIVEYFAPTEATPEQMGAELVEIAGSLLQSRD